MKVGSLWSGGNRRFKINDIKIVDNNTWIYYNNVLTKQEYSCLKEAFLQRFTEVINNG
jgi:hypothetical protein